MKFGTLMHHGPSLDPTSQISLKSLKFQNGDGCHLEKDEKIAISQNLLSDFDEICDANAYWLSRH